MRSQGKGIGVVGIFEGTAEGIKAPRSGTPGLSEEGQLPPCLRSRAYRGGLSGRGLVPFVHA